MDHIENLLVLNNELGVHVYSYYFQKVAILYPLLAVCSNYNTSVRQYYNSLCFRGPCVTGYQSSESEQMCHLLSSSLSIVFELH